MIDYKIRKHRIGYVAVLDTHVIAHGKTSAEARLKADKLIADVERENAFRAELRRADEAKRKATEKWLKELSKKHNCRRVSVVYYDKKKAVLMALAKAREEERSKK